MYHVSWSKSPEVAKRIGFGFNRCLDAIFWHLPIVGLGQIDNPKQTVN